MDMWAEYLIEREGKSCIWNEHGFAVYKIEGDNCYISEIYIKPESRRAKHAFFFGESVSNLAKGMGCKTITGSVVPSLPGATESLAGQIAFGFKVESSHNDFIILRKVL